MRVYINHMKLAAFIAAIATCSIGSSQENAEPDIKINSCLADEYCDPCLKTLECPPDVCAYNAPVILNSCPYSNLYITGSFLYWKASADYLAYAFLDNSFSSDPNNPANLAYNGEVISPSFKYEPGYKLGLGYKINRDHWDLYAEYTAFNQTVNSFIEVLPTGQHIHPLWLSFASSIIHGEEYRSADSSWGINLDILDAEVGRSFFCGKYLTLRPSLGLRTLWLDQKYNLTYVTYTQEIQIDSYNKSSSWGIGPKFGLSNTWNLCGGLKVLGDLEVSLLHVQDHVTSTHINPILILAGSSSDIAYGNKNTINILKPILDLSLGLGWGRPFFREKCSFDLELSYDYSLYWDQASIQLGHAPIVAVGGPPFIQVIVGNAPTSIGNLSIEGLKAKARFDF